MSNLTKNHVRQTGENHYRVGPLPLNEKRPLTVARLLIIDPSFQLLLLTLPAGENKLIGMEMLENSADILPRQGVVASACQASRAVQESYRREDQSTWKQPSLHHRHAAFTELSPDVAFLKRHLKPICFWQDPTVEPAQALLEQIKDEGYYGGYSQSTASSGHSAKGKENHGAPSCR